MYREKIAWKAMPPKVNTSWLLFSSFDLFLILNNKYISHVNYTIGILKENLKKSLSIKMAHIKIFLKKGRTSQVVLRLRFCLPVQGHGFSPCQGAKIPHAWWPKKKPT